MAVIKLAIVICFLIILIAKKLDLWISLLLCSIITSFLFGVNIVNFFKIFLFTLKDWSTISVMLVIFLVLSLSAMLESRESLEILKNSINKVVANKTFQLILPTALIGLLPMPGGALIGAPLVKSTAKDTNLTPSQLTFISYWFRHIWEYFWPLYPGLILASTLTQITLKELSKNQFIFTFLAIGTGLYILLKFKISSVKEKKDYRYIFLLLLNLSPILLIVILFSIFKLNIVLSTFISTSLTFIYFSLRGRIDIKLILKEVNYKSIIVIFFVMFFKNILNNSGSLKEFSNSLENIPFVLMISLLFYIIPMMIGFLTGVNHAYVAVSFPLFLPLIESLPKEVSLNAVSIAYIMGFAGVLLSPTHLCLVLTKEYFGAKFNEVYRFLIFPVFMMIFASGILGIFTFFCF